MTGFGELCAVCYSPLDRAEAAAEDGDPIDDVKRELFTTECNHTYHRCCLVRCREADFTLCCLCKTGRIDGHGLTPEHVREKRAAQAVVDAQNAQRNAVIGAAARAREAVRRQYVRAMVNRPAQSRSQIVMPPVTEEGSPGAGAVSDGAPGGQPPGSPARSIAASSAPATPARGVPVMRGGYPSPASRGGNSPHLRRSRASSSNSTNNDDDFDEPVFTTAAEELRARARVRGRGRRRVLHGIRARDPRAARLPTPAPVNERLTHRTQHGDPSQSRRERLQRECRRRREACGLCGKHRRRAGDGADAARGARDRPRVRRRGARRHRRRRLGG